MDEVAEKTDTVERPRDWDKAVSAAYLRSIGFSQPKAAASAGVGERTLARWELSAFWKDALDEAQDRWLSGLRQNARTLLLASMASEDGDPALALRVLERLEAPLHPKHTMEHTGAEGGIIQVNVTHEIIDPAER